MLSAIDSLRKYKKLVMVFPKYLKHPKAVNNILSNFCIDHGFLYEIYESTEECNPQQNVAYLINQTTKYCRIYKKKPETEPKNVVTISVY